MDSLKRFLDNDGLVNIWPKKQADKELVIAYLSSKFEFNHSYNELEINDFLKKWHTFNDWSLLRRELFERGYFDRNLSGTNYQRLK
jgi:hypothetical protein